MAEKKPQPPEVDEFGKGLVDAIRANEALLSALKYDMGQKVVQAQEGKGEYPSPHDLLAIKKLETQLEADKMFEQARRMTRRRRSAA